MASPPGLIWCWSCVARADLRWFRLCDGLFRTCPVSLRLQVWPAASILTNDGVNTRSRYRTLFAVAPREDLVQVRPVRARQHLTGALSMAGVVQCAGFDD